MKCQRTIMPDLSLSKCSNFYYSSPIDIGVTVAFADLEGKQITGKIIDFKSFKDGTIQYKVKVK